MFYGVLTSDLRQRVKAQRDGLSWIPPIMMGGILTLGGMGWNS